MWRRVNFSLLKAQKKKNNTKRDISSIGRASVLHATG